VDSTDSLDLQIDAMKLAFADIYEYASDTDRMRVKNADLLDNLTSSDQLQPSQAGMALTNQFNILVCVAWG